MNDEDRELLQTRRKLNEFSSGRPSHYFDRDGKPIGLGDWAFLHNDREYCIVARDEIDGVLVSTVWLGLDHSFGLGSPVIFETMIFGGLYDQDQERYHTEEGALAGHARHVERVRQSEAARREGPA